MDNQRPYQRKYKRCKRPFLVKILSYNFRRLNSEYCTLADGVNISPNGISFTFPRVIRKNDHLKILIHDMRNADSEDIMANVKVVWAEKKDPLSLRFGGKFVKISPEHKYKIMKLVRNNGGI